MIVTLTVSFKCRLMHLYIYEKQKENSLENITWDNKTYKLEVNCEVIFIFLHVFLD